MTEKTQTRTAEELVKKYDIVQDSKYITGKGYIYSDRINIRNVSLMNKDGARDEIVGQKPEILSYIIAQREAKEQAAQERQQKIDAIKGIKEIKDATKDLALWQAEFDRSFSDVGGLGVRPKPDYDFAALYEKYPVAKAYLDAESYADKDNFELAAIGRKALERIIYHPEEYREALDEMEKKLKDFRNGHLHD